MGDLQRRFPAPKETPAKFFGPVLVLLIFASAAIYVYAFLSPVRTNEPDISIQPATNPQPRIPECSAGETSVCRNSMNCTGHKICREERWSECIIKKACSPGARTGCFVNGCEMGYAVCNSCGTAYENCTS